MHRSVASEGCPVEQLTPEELQWRVRDQAHEMALKQGSSRTDGAVVCDCGMCYGIGSFVSRWTRNRHRNQFKKIIPGRYYEDAKEIDGCDNQHSNFHDDRPSFAR
jgi:hypothetical protein